MRLRPATQSISVLSVLMFSALLLNCGSGNTRLTQIMITPANQSIVKGTHLQLSATGIYSNGTKEVLNEVEWQTSQSGVATIDAQGNVTGMGEGVAQVSAVYQGVTGSTSVTVGPPALVSIAVSPNQSSLPVGEFEQLTATGTLSDGSTQDLTQSVTWSLSAPIASVSPAGVAVTSAVGTATISATSGSVTGTAGLTVTPAVLVAVNVVPATLSLPLGSGSQLQAIATMSDGTQQAITSSVTWQTSQSTVGTVNAQGYVTAVGKGAAQVSAAYQGITGTASLTVTSAAVVALNVLPATLSLPLGSSSQLQAIATMSDGTQQTVSSSATWQSSQSSVAAVNAQGYVTAAGKGAAQVSAAYQGMSGSASITVGPPALVSITVSPNQASLPLDETQQFTATGNFTDGSTQNLTQSVVWSSSASNIAVVNQTGMAVANAIGTATIGATSVNLTGTASLTVNPAAVVSLNIVPATLSITLGSSSQLQAIATFSDGTTQDMTATATWSSMQPAIAIVSSTGLTTAEAVGSTTILAQGSGFTASADITVMPLLIGNYFNRANAQQYGFDSTVRLTNPGLTGGDLCAMIYVFDDSQELQECCGCSISADGLLTLSLVNDLTANTLTGKQLVAGVIEIVSSDPTQNPQCNPGSLAPAGEIVGWGTNAQVSLSTFQVTEETFAAGALSSTQQTILANECGFLQTLGSGSGICTCGTGD
jgi:hypothetical protein